MGRPTFKCEDAINANANFSSRSAIFRTQLKYYVRADESRRAQNAIIEFAMSGGLPVHMSCMGGMHVRESCGCIYACQGI